MSLKEVKLRDFQYKITNKILVNKSFLHRINRTDGSLCKYCQQHPWVLDFQPCRGPGGSIPTGNVASLVSSNCPLWEERRGNSTRLPWVATRKPEEGILEVESYWEFVLS